MRKKHSTARPGKPAERETGQFVLRPHHVPIAGPGSPLPCPFCGSGDDVVIAIDPGQEGAHPAHVCAECDTCGAQGPFVTQDRQVAGMIRIADLVVAAARDWNKRGRL
jgi:Restriction alleviation protein Lar